MVGRSNKMQVTDEYLNICKKLPPRKPEEWRVGDWAILDTDGRPLLLYAPGIFKNNWYSPILDRIFMFEKEWLEQKRFIWIPHRESDWLKLLLKLDDRGGHYQLYPFNSKDGIWWTVEYESKPFGSIHTIEQDSDPLLALAKAWLKSKEVHDGN
jgi:hypothetical protein